MVVIDQGIFEKFIGIDWSGAKGSKNLRVAVCELGESVPKLEGEHWRRDELVEWIVKEANKRRMLVGTDFAFAYPYCDEGTYFPGLAESPKSVLALWQTIDSICQNERHFYAGPIYKDCATPFSDYFCYQDSTRRHYSKNRLRRTEDKVCDFIFGLLVSSNVWGQIRLAPAQLLVCVLSTFLLRIILTQYVFGHFIVSRKIYLSWLRYFHAYSLLVLEKTLENGRILTP